MSFKKSFIFLSLAAFFFQAGGSAAEARWEEPWAKTSSPAPAGHGAQPPSFGQRAAEGLSGIFRDYISPVDGDRCPMYPTCSQYGQQAIRKNGLVWGVIMTVDRLIHESDEMRRAPRLKVYESYRYYDPVENNDFWWQAGR